MSEQIQGGKFSNQGGNPRNTLMISPQNINSYNHEGGLNNNLHSDKAIESALNTMTTMQQQNNKNLQRLGVPPSGAVKQPLGRQNRNILQRNKTKRVNIDRKLIASHDFGAQQNGNNMFQNVGGGHSNQPSLGGQNNLAGSISGQTPSGVNGGIPIGRRGRKTERNNNFMAQSHDFGATNQMNFGANIP